MDRDNTSNSNNAFSRDNLTLMMACYLKKCLHLCSHQSLSLGSSIFQCICLTALNDQSKVNSSLFTIMGDVLSVGPSAEQNVPLHVLL